MVYQDYELVSTKRVGHSRSSGLLLLKRQFYTAGGFNTVYMTAFFGMAGSAFKLTSSTPLVRPLMSSAGLMSVARNSLSTGAPALIGFCVGVSAFGNGTELWNLIRNAPTYSREFKEVRTEQYY